MSSNTVEISPASHAPRRGSGTLGKGVVAVTNFWPPMAAGTGHTLRAMMEGLRDAVVLAPRVSGLEASDSLRVVPILRFSGKAGGPFKLFSILQHIEIILTTLAWCIKPGRARASLLVCVHPLFAGVGGLCARLLLGMPYVTLIHGEELTLVLAGPRRLGIRRRLLESTLQRTSVVICNTENTRQLAIRLYNVPESKLRVIYPAINVESWPTSSASEAAALRQNLAGQNRLILTAGRLGETRKGFDMAIRALPEVLREVPGVSLVVAGPGDAAPLAALARAEGVEDRVIFTGEMRREELALLFTACDLFLLPGREIEGTAEGFGLVFLEAALAGKAVVAGRAGGVSEAVLDGETGLLVDGEVPTDVARAVVRLLRDPALADQLGARGRQRVLAEFDGRRQHHQFIELLSEILGRPESSAP